MNSLALRRKTEAEADADRELVRPAKMDPSGSVDTGCTWLQVAARQFRDLHDSAVAQLLRVEQIACELSSHSLKQHVELLQRTLDPLDLRLNDFATRGLVACGKWRSHLVLLQKARRLTDGGDDASGRLAFALAEKNRTASAREFATLVEECRTLRDDYTNFLDDLSVHKSELAKIQADCVYEKRMARLKLGLAVLGGLLAIAGGVALCVFCPPAAVLAATVAVCGTGAGVAAGAVGYTAVVTALCGMVALSGKAGCNALESLDKIKNASRTASLWTAESERAYATCKIKRDGLARAGNSCKELKHLPASDFVFEREGEGAPPSWEEFLVVAEDCDLVQSIYVCDCVDIELRTLQVKSA